MNEANWIMASFTILVAFFTGLVAYFTCRLVEATKEYTEVTKKLLNQSKEAFDQSKEAFENERKALQREAMNRIVSSAVQLDAQFGTFQVQDTNRKNYVRSFASAMLKFLNEVDPDIYEKTLDTLKTWTKTDKGQFYKWIFQGELDKPSTNT